MLQASVLLLVVSIWFPGATRIAGTDGSISFFLGLYCAVVSVVFYGQLTTRLHRTEAAFATAVLTTSTAIIVLSLLSMLHADNPIRTMRAVFAQVFGFALIPAVLVISMRPDGFEAVDRIVLAVIVMSVVTSCLVMLGMGDARFSDRAEGYFKHANQLGIALSAGLPLVAAVLVISRKYRVLLWGCLAAVVLGLVKSGSKTNFIVGISGLGIFFGLYGIYLTIRRQRPLSIIAGVLTAPLLLGASVLTLQFLNPRAYRLLTVQLTGGEAHSIVSRERLWSISIDLGLLHPFTGVGAGQPVGDIAPHSHNLLIEYFRTLGVPGLALIIVMVLLVATYLISAILLTLNAKGASEHTGKADVMVLGSAVSVLNYVVANQMSDSFGPSTAPFFWLPLALLMFYRGLQRSVRSGLGANAELKMPAAHA
ncbi:O-antigen ligase family protein [Pseudaminobacter sp. 19-2017]|uniref:O-antigen ligase family protein n=1 Tax=Pseudaminobacter soli (ex Zhang et al. 2022) TaxID=2831468 RepID=A0A942I4M2_9HYPH|nr:O-antigen ligase family protein [Pseudaminobacter soli]MBS3651694.1 O-antigen ligase family protein [Pseudaminobacter soli]